jgi:carbon-monoxide dehydrogenase large subunit
MTTEIREAHSGAMGQSVARKEDRRLITGHGNYVSDLNLPLMRHVAFLRSPYGHAEIRNVDTSDAEAGTYAVFSGASAAFDSIGLTAKSALPSYVETTQPALARHKVRFAGEPVAAVVAESRYAAEDALERIVVDYNPLPATVRAWDPPAVPVHAEAPDNVLLEREFEAGDVDTSFAQADVVLNGNLLQTAMREIRWNAGPV